MSRERRSDPPAPVEGVCINIQATALAAGGQTKISMLRKEFSSPIQWRSHLNTSLCFHHRAIQHIYVCCLKTGWRDVVHASLLTSVNSFPADFHKYQSLFARNPVGTSG